MQAKMCRDQITHSAGQNIKWYNHSGEQFGSFFKKKKKKSHHSTFSCPTTSEILAARPGIQPVSLALEGRFLTTGPPGKSPNSHS